MSAARMLKEANPQVQASRSFHVLTVGWELSLIASLTIPVASYAGMRFTHGLVGDARRVPLARKQFPGVQFVALSKANGESLPPPDYELLRRLESVGVPTIRTMVQGDRVLRRRPELESLGYATLLARQLRSTLEELKPDVVLGSFDSLHASLSLAVCRSLGIPWVALAFTVIPNDLTGFCAGMTPDTLVPIVRTTDEALRRHAEETMRAVRARRQQIVAYRPPASLSQRVGRFVHYGRNLGRRLVAARSLGVDRFTYPTARERFGDIARRWINHVRLPRRQMLKTPPEGRFVFFPLQMAPESSIDTWAPFYHNQLALLMQVWLAVPADLELVVKLHFSDHDNYTREQLMELARLPRLRIAHPNASSHAFLEKASLVVAIQGTASLEAALLAKPVLLFGASPYEHFPRTERARRPDDLFEQIRRMVETPPPSDGEIVEAFARYMSRYMSGRINDWSRPIADDEARRLAECFSALRDYLDSPERRAAWYLRAPFVNGSEALSPQ